MCLLPPYYSISTFALVFIEAVILIDVCILTNIVKMSEALCAKMQHAEAIWITWPCLIQLSRVFTVKIMRRAYVMYDIRSHSFVASYHFFALHVCVVEWYSHCKAPKILCIFCERFYFWEMNAFLLFPFFR